MAKPKIGFIGVGNMGTPMAGRIAQHGYPLRIFDADRAKARQLAQELGCEVAESGADLGRECEIIISMLPNGNIVRDVMLGDDGVAANLAPGSLLIEMSSSDPVGTRELAKILREKGIAIIDAPVSGTGGGVQSAAAGTLSIMVGSDNKEDTERAWPILETMGTKLTEAGPLGAGHAAKAVNNLLAATNVVACAEVILVCEKFGLDTKKIFDIINDSTGRSVNTENLAKRLPNVFGKLGFRLELMRKDVRLATGIAESVDVRMPLAEYLESIFTDACERFENADLGDIHRYVRAVSGMDDAAAG